MAFKSILVEAYSTGRDKVNLAEKIEKEVNNVVGKGELTGVQFQADIQTGGFGTAVVLIAYEKEEKKDATHKK